MPERLTRPQKVGLPVGVNINLRGPTGRLRRLLLNRGVQPARRFSAHSDPRQEAFFALIKDLLRHATVVRGVRPDVFDRIAARGDCKAVSS